jgi:hypothetical protein
MTTKIPNHPHRQPLEKPGARLTALDALRMFGVSRAAARIEELRKQGMAIQTTMVPVVGMSGTARVAEYSLAGQS